MLKKLSLAGAALAMGVTAVVPATPAFAQGGYYRDYDDRYDDRRAYRGRTYDRGRYGYRCRRSGTTGTIIGAIAGGLLGREIIGRRGDRTAGAIVGAGVGALAGREIDKSSGRCR